MIELLLYFISIFKNFFVLVNLSTKKVPANHQKTFSHKELMYCICAAICIV